MSGNTAADGRLGGLLKVTIDGKGATASLDATSVRTVTHERPLSVTKQQGITFLADLGCETSS